jgi:hypothetical protein
VCAYVVLVALVLGWLHAAAITGRHIDELAAEAAEAEAAERRADLDRVLADILNNPNNERPNP